jgi:hypothetical protein
MPQMNGTGPDKKGKETGRGLGKCHPISTEESLEKLGAGMGLRRQSDGGKGNGKRMKAGLDNIKH